MAVPARVLPRRAEPTDLMKVTPSGRVNFQGLGSGGVPKVSASSAIQQPTPYVGKAAKRTDLFELAEGLQYFNGEIGKLAYTQRVQWEESQVEKAKTDAITNPEKVAEVFRLGIDRAVEQGLFPRYAHPKYRFAYLETGAKNMALSGLPAYLEENTKQLGSADSMEPIESTVNSLIDRYAEERGLTSTPNAYAAFREAAFQTSLRVSAERRKEREKNFDTAQIEGLDQTISGLSRGLLDSLKLENDNDRQLASDAVYRDLQTAYDSIRRDYPQVDATKQFTTSFISGLNASVNKGELHPREAMMVLKDAASKLKAGTGAWSDISDVQAALSGAYATWENKAVQLDSINKQKVNEQDEKFQEAVLNKLQEARDQGTFDSLNATTDMDKIGREAALLVNPDLANDPVALRRSVRDLKIQYATTVENENKYLQDIRWIEDEITNDPKGAARLLKTMYDSRQLTKATYDAYIKKAEEAADISSYLREGGFDAKLGNIEGLARDSVAPKGGIGGSAVLRALTSDQSQKIVNLQVFGEDFFRTTATELVRQNLAADPSLREPANATQRVGVVQKSINEAYAETIKRMTQELEASKDPLSEQKEKENAEKYGSMAQKVAVLEDAVNQLQEISPSGLTNPQTADFKVRISKAPQDLSYIASQIGMATGEEKKRLLNAYQKMVSVVGYGPQAILTGKTEDGIEVPIEEAKKNPMNTPIFRNEDEFNAVFNEAKSAAAAKPETLDLMAFVQKVEGFKPKAYWDYKQWSIGYGTKSYQGESITEEEAAVRLDQELAGHASRVDMASEEAGLILTEGQRNALISFDFNTGEAVSVIKRFAGDPSAMKKKMMEFVNVTDNGQLVKSKGLENRRLQESALFDSGDITIAEPFNFEESTLVKILDTLGVDKNNPDEFNEFLRRQKALSKQRSF